MVVVLFLILTLVVFRISARVIWLVLALAAVILSVFGSLTGFVFLLLHLPVLSVLLRLHQLPPLLLSGIIGWDIYVVLGYPHLYVVVFWEMSLVMFL
jgi:hypothetical protein